MEKNIKNDPREIPLNECGDLMSHIELCKKLDREEESILYKCPKADKCVMVCQHKNPHEHMNGYCDGIYECPKCVPEIISDVIFFREDFEL